MILFTSFLLLFVRFFDTFAGIGGFALPLTEAGHECVGFSEIDKYAQQIYLSHFPSHHPYGDITKLEPAALPDFDLLVGGFPCQAFSIAGKRGGFADTRGTLFFDLARLLQAKKPRLFVFENVKGLLSHDAGRTFKTIIATLDELGYDLQWQVLNSKHFGVPQNRERVFIVGHLRGTPRPEVFPFGNSDQSPDKERDEQPLCAGTLSTKNQSPQCQFDGSTTLIYDMKAVGSRTRRGVVKHEIVGALDHNCAQGVAIRGRNHHPTLERRSDGVANALRASEGGSSKAMVMETIATIGPMRSDGRYRPRERVMAPGIARAVTTFETQMPFYCTPQSIRRLTPIECERLQGFPDNWTQWGAERKPSTNEIGGPPYKDCLHLISDTQRYKCLGNAVTVNVVREIVKRLPSAA